MEQELAQFTAIYAQIVGYLVEYSFQIVGAVIVFLIGLPKIGIQITPFIAAIGAVGLGAGLAVQGLLSNYSAGLSIIFTRLFVVGDTIRVRGVWGIVEEVHLSHTVLTNEDGEVITIPNKHTIGEIILTLRRIPYLSLMSASPTTVMSIVCIANLMPAWRSQSRK